MAREMDEILRQQIAQPANSCTFDSVEGVSFLDNVIFPLYDIISAVSFTNFSAIISHTSSKVTDDPKIRLWLMLTTPRNVHINWNKW